MGAGELPAPLFLARLVEEYGAAAVLGPAPALRELVWMRACRNVYDLVREHAEVLGTALWRKPLHDLLRDGRITQGEYELLRQLKREGLIDATD